MQVSNLNGIRYLLYEMEVFIHYKMKLMEFKPKNPIEKSVKPVHYCQLLTLFCMPTV